MAGVIKLPAEIFRNIFSNFCCHCRGEYNWPSGTEQSNPNDTQTLYNLCLVSRQFSRAAQETLHHTFDPNLEYWEHDQWKRRLEPFLQTIASRPDLARSVKALFLRVPLIEALDYYDSRDAFHSCLQSRGVNALEICQRHHVEGNSGPSNLTQAYAIERVFFLRELRPLDITKEDYIPIVASQLLTVLVCMLPVLAYLGIAESHSTRETRWQFDTSEPTLEALGVQTLPITQFESDQGLDQLLSRSPNLKTFITRGHGKLPKMPSVKSLHLRSKTCVDFSAIKYCLDACTGHLSTFTYTSVDANYQDIIRCLDQSRLHATLESIHLDLRCIGGTSNLKTMPSLKQFTKLRKLFIMACSVYGINLTYTTRQPLVPESLFKILPSSIESLTVMEHVPTLHGCLWEDLVNIAGAKHNLFPQLKQVRSNSDEIREEQIQALFKQVDVALSHQYLPELTRSCTGQLPPLEYCSPHESPLLHGQAMPLPGELSDDDL